MQDLVPLETAEIGLVNGRPTIRGDCDVANAAKIGYWLASFGKATMFDFKRHRRIEHYGRITSQVGTILPPE